MINMIEFRAMGCEASVQLEAENSARLLEKIPQQVAAIEDRLTRFKATSELMQFNAQAGKTQQVSRVLFDNIAAAKQAARITDGLFNPLILPALIASGYDRSFERIAQPKTTATQPALDWRDIRLSRETYSVQIPEGNAIDLGGVAKGWTAMYVADVLAKYGTCVVNIGGDIVARNAPDGYDGWPIEIEDPFSGEAFASINLKDSSIVTSGVDYRRWQDANGSEYHHIINPNTGLPAVTDVVSVTVVHPHAPTAEAYAKAVLIKGADAGLIWLNQQWNAEGIVFQADGTVLGTSNLSSIINQRNHS